MVASLSFPTKQNILRETSVSWMMVVLLPRGKCGRPQVSGHMRGINGWQMQVMSWLGILKRETFGNKTDRGQEQKPHQQCYQDSWQGKQNNGMVCLLDMSTFVSCLTQFGLDFHVTCKWTHCLSFSSKDKVTESWLESSEDGTSWWWSYSAIDPRFRFAVTPGVKAEVRRPHAWCAGLSNLLCLLCT